MIAIDDKARRAIDNIRALLDTMLASGWAEVCVTGRDGDYFLARHPGTPNPLIEPVGEVAPLASAPVAATVAHVKAPHVGTVAWLAPLGTRLAEGEVAARLMVLDESVDVLAAGAGTVRAHGALLDELAEFATPLVELVA